MNKSRSKRGLKQLAVFLLAAGAASCAKPGYRVEVYPGQQGQTEIRRVPLTPEEQAQQRRVQQITAAAAVPGDSDILTLESLWPRVSPADRAAIMDMAKRSAAAEK